MLGNRGGQLSAPDVRSVSSGKALLKCLSQESDHLDDLLSHVSLEFRI